MWVATIYSYHRSTRIIQLNYIAGSQNILDAPSTSTARDATFTTQPSPPHMVLRKGICKIKQGMKKYIHQHIHNTPGHLHYLYSNPLFVINHRYNNQLSLLRTELRNSRKKALEQSKLISEQQKLIADQQKGLNENETKIEEVSRKLSALVQELNKYYWRFNSSMCSTCGPRGSPPAMELMGSLLERPGAIEPSQDQPLPEQYTGGVCSPKRKRSASDIPAQNTGTATNNIKRPRRGGTGAAN